MTKRSKAILTDQEVITDSMDWPGEHYAKGSQSVRERQIPYDFIYMGI